MAVDEPPLTDLPIEPLSAQAFAPFGTVIAAGTDGAPFGAEDAQLELSAGTPCFYIMRIPGRGLVVKGITRHRACTQVLASVGGQPWTLMVAPAKELDDPAAEPALADIRSFAIPGDVAVMLYRGSWHAGPLYEGGERGFFNLELADTNLADHQTCTLTERYGTAMRLIA